MATIVWPTTLPRALRADSYTEVLAEGTIRTEMDEGPAKVRALPTRDYDKVSGNILVTIAQWALLRDFYKVTTKGGVLPFEWVEMTDHSITVDYRFTEPPSIRPLEKESTKGLLASISLERVG